MNFTIHQLQVFLKVAQTRSITKAAEALHLTQPAVSIQLRNLQDQFDIPLTEVVGRKLYITSFGQEIAAAAEQIVQEVQAIRFKTQAFRGHLTGRLHLSVVSTGKYVMPYFLSDFIRKNNEVELIMDVTNKTKVVESLEKNEVDFSLVSILPPYPAVQQLELLEHKLFLVGSRELARKQVPLKQMFEEHPLIFRESGSGTRQTMEQFLQRQQLRVRKKMELTSNEAVKQAVLAGLGYSVMPLIGIKNELKAGSIRIIPVKGLPIKTAWRLIWPKGKNHSPVATAFLQHLQAHKADIIKKYFGGLGPES